MPSVYVGLMGLGVVGSGVASILRDKAESITAQVGGPVEIKRVLVRDPSKTRDGSLPDGSLTTDAVAILDDPTISVVIELMGGEQPAYDYMQRALKAGKHVITANKEVIAKHGPTLLALAQQHGVAI